MKEVKFRVWDKIEKRLIDWNEIKKGRYTIGLLLTSKLVQLNSIILLYTQQKDINKREIYDGDIIGVQDTPIGVVGYIDGAFIIEDNEGNLMRLSYFNILAYKWEKIGNIYENPGLIKNNQ